VVLRGAADQLKWHQEFLEKLKHAKMKDRRKLIESWLLKAVDLGAVEERHAGIASGINNAVSRVAGLFAVAVFGVLMVTSFQRGLTQRMNDLPLSAEQKDQISSQSNDLLNLKIPDDVDPRTANMIKSDVRDSFVGGFRSITFASAGLAIASAFSAWLLIEGKSKSKKHSADQ
jgi:hypothetical protein